MGFTVAGNPILVTCVVLFAMRCQKVRGKFQNGKCDQRQGQQHGQHEPKLEQSIKKKIHVRKLPNILAVVPVSVVDRLAEQYDYEFFRQYAHSNIVVLVRSQRSYRLAAIGSADT
jgi:hypothetical protein